MTGDRRDPGAYVVAGTDLAAFVAAWLRDVVETDTGLLQLAVDDPFEGDRYFYGMAGLMSGIAPRVVGGGGRPEELLLYAVLAVYQDHLGLQPSGEWAGPAEHVWRALRHVQDIGERAAADALRRVVGRRATRTQADVELDELVGWKKKTVGQRAAHEQTMAAVDQRNLRAAQALDGTTGDPWLAMPSV